MRPVDPRPTLVGRVRFTYYDCLRGVGEDVWQVAWAWFRVESWPSWWIVVRR